MEFETVKKIVEAEQEAERIKEDAKQKAKIILEQVEKTNENNVLYFKSQLDAKQKELEESQAKQNREATSKIKAETTEKLQKIREESQGKISEAVEKIFLKVVKL